MNTISTIAKTTLETIAKLTVRDLIALAFAMNDAEKRSADPNSMAGQVERDCIQQYQALLSKLDPDSEDALFLRRFLIEATSLNHHISGSARLLNEKRQFSKERHSLSLAREAAVTGFSALLRLSGQLFLIGGATGIITWITLGKSHSLNDPTTQILMSIAIAFGGMILGMAWQLRSMSNAQKHIDRRYYQDKDIAKEMQIDRLIGALERTQANFIFAWEDRFGVTPTEKQSSIEIELKMLKLHKDIGDLAIDNLTSGFVLFFRRVFGLDKKNTPPSVSENT